MMKYDKKTQLIRVKPRLGQINEDEKMEIDEDEDISKSMANLILNKDETHLKNIEKSLLSMDTTAASNVMRSNLTFNVKS